MTLYSVHDTGNPLTNGNNLQARLTNADSLGLLVGGDIVELDANIEYCGPIGLPALTLSSPVIIRTHNINTNVPLNSGGWNRITPDGAAWTPSGCNPAAGVTGGNAFCAKITTSNLFTYAEAGALYTASGAGTVGTGIPVNGSNQSGVGLNGAACNNWTLQGIEFLCSPTISGSSAGQTQVSTNGTNVYPNSFQLLTLVQLGNNDANQWSLNISTLGLSGTFTLTYGGVTTAAIAWSSTLSTLINNIASACNTAWEHVTVVFTEVFNGIGNNLTIDLLFSPVGLMTANFSGLSGGTLPTLTFLPTGTSGFFVGPRTGAPTMYPQVLYDYSQFPNNLIFDRCIFWSGYPGPNPGIDATKSPNSQVSFNQTFDATNTRGFGPATWGQSIRHLIQVHTKAATFTNCYAYDCKGAGTDSNSFSGINLLGPISFQNGYLSGSTECWIMGGALAVLQNLGGTANSSSPALSNGYYASVQLGSAVPGYTPAQSTVQYNTIEHAKKWNPLDSTYDGSGWWVKNLFEFKAGGNCLVNQNTFNHSWYAVDQRGHCFLITPRAGPSGQGGVMVQCANITYSNNHIVDCYRGMEIIGTDTFAGSNTNAGLHTKNITVQDNLFEDAWYWTHNGRVAPLFGYSFSNSGAGSVTLTMDGSLGLNVLFNNDSSKGSTFAFSSSAGTNGEPFNKVWLNISANSGGSSIQQSAYLPDWEIATITNVNQTGTIDGGLQGVGTMTISCAKAHQGSNLMNSSGSTGYNVLVSGLVSESSSDPTFLYIDGGAASTGNLSISGQTIVGDNGQNTLQNVVINHNTITTQRVDGNGTALNIGGSNSYHNGTGAFAHVGVQFLNNVVPTGQYLLHQFPDQISDNQVQGVSSGSNIPAGLGSGGGANNSYCFEELLADGTSGYENNLFFLSGTYNFTTSSLQVPATTPVTGGTLGASSGYLGSGSAGNLFESAATGGSSPQFANWNSGAGGTYSLLTSSPGHGTATDGTDIGCRNFTWYTSGSGPVVAARVNSLGFGTGDAAEVISGPGGTTYTLTGTASIQSVVTHAGGAYALRANPTTTALGGCAVVAPSATTGAAGVMFNIPTAYHRFYFRYHVKPAANDEEICFFYDNPTAAHKGSIRLNSSGNLAAYASDDATVLGTGTTVLAVDTWYRIEVLWGTGSGASWAVRINGTLEISGTSSSIGANNNGYLGLGKLHNRNGNSVDFYYADVAIDSSTYPGAGVVRALIAHAAGNYSQWTTGTGPSDYTQLTTVPPAGATYVATSTSGNAFTAKLQSAESQGLVGMVATSVKACAIAENASGGAGNMHLRVRSQGSNFDLSNADPGAGNGYQLFGEVLANDPGTSQAWTVAGIDQAEVGMVNGAAAAARLDYVALMIDFPIGPGTAIAVSSTNNPTVIGTAVTFTAAVTAVGATPSGTVQFAIDGTNFGSAVTLSAGSATSGSVSTLTLGTHTVTATYSGDVDFATNSGQILQVMTVPAGLTAAFKDNGNGTVTVTVRGGSSTATNSIMYQAADGNIIYPFWTTAGTISGNGSLTFTIKPGVYWGQIQNIVIQGGNTVVTVPPLIYFGATDGKATTHELAVEAVIARLQGMQFLGTLTSPSALPPANIIQGLVPVEELVNFPCLYVTHEAEAESLPPYGAGTNFRDDYGFPIKIAIVDQMDLASMADQTARREKYLFWRAQIMQAFSRQRLGGVPIIFDCQVTPGVVISSSMASQKYVVTGCTLRFFARLTRGLSVE